MIFWQLDAQITRSSPFFHLSNALCLVLIPSSQVSLLNYPSLTPVAEPFEIPKSGGDIYDVDFFGEYVRLARPLT